MCVAVSVRVGAPHLIRHVFRYRSLHRRCNALSSFFALLQREALPLERLEVRTAAGLAAGRCGRLVGGLLAQYAAIEAQQAVRMVVVGHAANDGLSGVYEPEHS